MSVRGSDENLYKASSDSFWDIGNYKRTVKRVDDGAKLCDDFMKLVCERAEIEAKYAFKLKAWAKKWEELIKSGPEYATMETATRGTVGEAEARSELHMQCRDRLIENVNEALKKWKQENYHKGIFQWKETKEADEGFAKAQKPWAKRLGKLLKSKKAYHAASRSTEDALRRENEVNRDSEKSAERVKKLQEATEKAKREMERCKEKYQVRLDEITEYNPQYEQDMKQEFGKCQASEERRLDFFKGSLADYHRCLNISESPQLRQMFANMIETFQRAQTEQNLDWWSKNHGVDMPQYWPVFEKTEAHRHSHQGPHKRKRRESIFHRLQACRKPSEESILKELSIEHLDTEYQVGIKPDKETDSETESWSTFSDDDAVCEAVVSTEKEQCVSSPFPASVAREVESVACSSKVEDHYNSPLYCFIQDITPSDTEEFAGTELSPVDEPLARTCSEDAPQIDLDADRLLESSASGEEHDDPPLSRRPTLNKGVQPSAPSEPPPSFAPNNMVYGVFNNHVEESPHYEDSDQFSEPASTEPPDYMYDSPSKWEGEPAPPIDDEVGAPVQALYDFDGQEQDELSFKQGDILTKLSQRDNQGWCQGRFQGKVGHFPDDYVKPV